MPAEVRVDPLTGLRTLIDVDGVEAHEDLFTALADSHTEERISGGPAAWRERMRAHPDAACLHLTATGLDSATLYALDFVPAALARERERFSAYAVRTMGGNLLGDLVGEEVRRRERLVAYDHSAVAFAPYASQVPFQLVVAPRVPAPRYEEDEGTGDALLAETLTRLGERELDLWVRTAPRGADAYCWRIDILPRTEPDALTRGTGLHACPVSPESAAAQLRA